MEIARPALCGDLLIAAAGFLLLCLCLTTVLSFFVSIVTLFVADVRMCRTINKGQRSCPKRHGWPDHCKYAKNGGVSINAYYFGTERRLGFGIKKLHLSKEGPCLVVRQYIFRGGKVIVIIR